MINECHIGQKTLWEKEKLLVTSNFSFFHNVFHRYISKCVKMQDCMVMGYLLVISLKSLSTAITRDIVKCLSFAMMTTNFSDL